MRSDGERTLNLVKLIEWLKANPEHLSSSWIDLGTGRIGADFYHEILYLLEDKLKDAKSWESAGKYLKVANYLLHKRNTYESTDYERMMKPVQAKLDELPTLGRTEFFKIIEALKFLRSPNYGYGTHENKFPKVMGKFLRDSDPLVRGLTLDLKNNHYPRILPSAYSRDYNAQSKTAARLSEGNYDALFNPSSPDHIFSNHRFGKNHSQIYKQNNQELLSYS